MDLDRKQKQVQQEADRAASKQTRDTPLERTKSCEGLGISLPGCVILNSKPGGGKSHLLRYIMYCNRHKFKHGIVFSNSVFRKGNMDYIPTFEDTPEDKKEYLNFKHPIYDETILMNFLNGQMQYEEEERPLGFVLFDDAITDPGMWMSAPILKAATMYRHFNIFLGISTQYINKIPPIVRECASQVGLFWMAGKRSSDAAYESYGQDFDDAKSFARWLDHMTGPANSHKFAWKDKFNEAPWRICRAPETIPRFRIDYGKISELDGKKPKKRKRKQAKPKLNAVQRNFVGLGNHIKNKIGKYGHEDVPPEHRPPKRAKRELNFATF